MFLVLLGTGPAPAGILGGTKCPPALLPGHSENRHGKKALVRWYGIVVRGQQLQPAKGRRDVVENGAGNQPGMARTTPDRGQCFQSRWSVADGLAVGIGTVCGLQGEHHPGHAAAMGRTALILERGPNRSEPREGTDHRYRSQPGDPDPFRYRRHASYRRVALMAYSSPPPGSINFSGPKVNRAN